MQQTTIQFQEGTQAVRPQVAPVDVMAENFAEWLTNAKARLMGWYNSESRMYSSLIGESISWRAVIRVHMILVCMLVTIGAVEQNFMVAGASMASTGWLVYRLNVEDKNKAQQPQGKKEVVV